MLIYMYITNVHGLEQLVHFPTREKNTLDLILNSRPGQFQEIHSPDKLSDHGVVSGTLTGLRFCRVSPRAPFLVACCSLCT